MKLGPVIAAWRESTGKNIRDAAREIGISKATLSRIERNKPADGNTVVRLIFWLLGSEK